MAVTLVSSILFAILSIFLIGALFSSLLKETELSHDPDSILTLSLSMNLTDRPGGFRLEDLTRQALTEEAEPPQLHLYEVLEALKRQRRIQKLRHCSFLVVLFHRGMGVGTLRFMNLSKGSKILRNQTNRLLDIYGIPPSWIIWFILPVTNCTWTQVEAFC